MRGACDMGIAPNRLPGYRHLDDQEAQQRLQRLWGKNLPSTPCLNADSPIAIRDRVNCLGRRSRRGAADGTAGNGCAGENRVFGDAGRLPHTNRANGPRGTADCEFWETEGTITSMEGRVQKLRVATDARARRAPDGRCSRSFARDLARAASYTSANDVLLEVGQGFQSTPA